MRDHQRRKIEIFGSVQGIGFRPFVYRLALELRLGGWVTNDARGVTVEIEGEAPRLDQFVARVERERPAGSTIESITVADAEPAGEREFRIRRSKTGGDRTAQVLPELATCDDCLAELFDPENRRHRYPFTNCTHCGPRFSIQLSIPYDRPRTTMRGFELCDACRAEYEDPGDRRFHAQPNACPDCGPQLRYLDESGEPLAEKDVALRSAAADLSRGRVVAVKGLGGFHLMADARDGATLRRLRDAKPRREKPFALMVRDLDRARELCALRPEEERALVSSEAPIVLASKRADAPIDDAVAPGNPYLGVMLAYTPLHHLLTGAVDFPLVATSGNLSDEPICIDETEALERLRGVADRFLVHDRPIARHVDDSVACSFGGEVRLLRRARGYAPRAVLVRDELPTILAVGGHLKNSVALSVGRRVFVSQHIGDMETPEALGAFERVIEDFLNLYGVAPEAVAHDLHPDYASTRWVERATSVDGPLARLPAVAVQHHHAHLASVLAEHGDEPALGVIWDGTGYGTDATVWGGEFLRGDARGFRRAARLRPFRLPGGEAAVREPRRTGLALLWELRGEAAFESEPGRAFEPPERRVLASMLGTGTRAPLTTSAGRLFDGVAALVGLRQRMTFEGQAAMELEFVADPAERGSYAIDLRDDGDGIELDWGPAIEAILEDRLGGVAVETIAGRFHNALADAILAVVRRLDEPRVALSGGCFQNRLLLDRTVERLAGNGSTVLLQRRVPPNDGGLSLGQIRVAAARLM